MSYSKEWIKTKEEQEVKDGEWTKNDEEEKNSCI